MDYAVHGLDGWSRTGSHHTEDDSLDVMRKVVDFYGLGCRKFCQVLGGPGTPHVVNAHLWPNSNQDALVLLGLSKGDIDDPRNVLRLHRSIERAFDGKQQLQGLCKTFRDIDGELLIFPGYRRPWHRCITTHSFFAHQRNGEALPESLNRSMALYSYSIDSEAQGRISRMLERAGEL